MDRVWYGEYEPGVAHEIDMGEYASGVDIIESSFAKYPAKGAFANMGKILTYADLDQLTRQFAAYLQNELGLKKGDRVAIMMPNVLQYPIALFGAHRAGLTVVNVNPLYTARELEHQLKDSGAETIVILANFANTLEQVIRNTPVKNVIVAKIGDMLGFPKGALINFVVKSVKKMVPPWHIPGAVPFKSALAIGAGSSLKRVDLNHDDIAFLQYTGGTTGVAKGAILTHGNIVANMLQARTWLTNLIKEGEEIVITPLPLYHIFSLTANCLVFSSIGGLNVLITNPRDIPGFVKELKSWQFTAITGVNTLFNGLLNNPDFAQVDFTHNKVSLGGGMAVQRPVAEKWKQVTGVPLIEAYGLTETSPAACINPLNLKAYNGMIGLPIPSTDVSVRDESEKEVPQGERGELCIKGPQVMRGYYNKPEETKLVFTADGWLKTGDIAIMDEQGYFKIVDRKKDMILVSGFNVFPNEVEDVASGHPGVLEVAAIGVPDPKSTEVVKLFVVKKDPALTADEIKAYCKEHLTGYKVPRQIEFRDELPKTNVGKILRRALKEEEKNR
ncbi:MAG: long-chain-fatty-acid--CoA ligase [Myxococcota bacterium]|nr:long-chain-fatty-acid--CoA ligase [Myxococcota bacterium]